MSGLTIIGEGPSWVLPVEDRNVLYRKYLDQYTPDICARILLVSGLLKAEDYTRPGVITQSSSRWLSMEDVLPCNERRVEVPRCDSEGTWP